MLQSEVRVSLPSRESRALCFGSVFLVKSLFSAQSLSRRGWGWDIPDRGEKGKPARVPSLGWAL